MNAALAKMLKVWGRRPQSEPGCGRPERNINFEPNFFRAISQHHPLKQFLNVLFGTKSNKVCTSVWCRLYETAVRPFPFTVLLEPVKTIDKMKLHQAACDWWPPSCTRRKHDARWVRSIRSLILIVFLPVYSSSVLRYQALQYHVDQEVMATLAVSHPFHSRFLN